MDPNHWIVGGMETWIHRFGGFAIGKILYKGFDRNPTLTNFLELKEKIGFVR